MDDVEAFARLEVKADELGLKVVTSEVSSVDNSAFLEYRDFGKTRMQREDDVRELAKQYVSLVERGWDSDWLSANLVDGYGAPILTWKVADKWQKSYLNGEMSKSEVAEKAVNSIF